MNLVTSTESNSLSSVAMTEKKYSLNKSCN
jgi:hypothetical protein